MIGVEQLIQLERLEHPADLAPERFRPPAEVLALVERGAGAAPAPASPPPP
jgi:hypothetical protein